MLKSKKGFLKATAYLVLAMLFVNLCNGGIVVQADATSAVEAVNSTSVSMMGQVLIDNNADLGLNLTGNYALISDKSFVHRDLYNKSFADVSSIQTAFNNSVASWIQEYKIKAVDNAMIGTAGWQPDSNMRNNSHTEMVTRSVVYNMLMRFDLKSVPSNSNIAKIVLGMTNKDTAGSNYSYTVNGLYGSDTSVTPNRINSWAHNTVTFNTRPANEVQVATGSAPKGTTGELDVTSYVQSRIAADDKIITLMFTTTTSPTNTDCNFYALRTFASAPYVKVIYDKTAAITAVNSASSDTISSVLQNNNILGLNTNGYAGLTNKSLVNQEVIGKNFTSLTTLQTTFNNAISALCEQQNIVVTDNSTVSISSPDNTPIRWNSIYNTTHHPKDQEAMLFRFVLTSTNNIGRVIFRVYESSSLFSDSSYTYTLNGHYGDRLTTWTHNKVTWNTRPDVDQIIVADASSKHNNWLEYDITSYVKSRIAEGDTQITLSLLPNIRVPIAELTLNAKFNALNEPQLLVVQDLSAAVSRYSINSVTYKNQAGGIETGLTNSGKVESITVLKNVGLPATETSKAIVCLYKGNEMTDVIIADFNDALNKGGTLTIPINLTLPSNVSDYRIRVFIWSDLTNLQPFSVGL